MGRSEREGLYGLRISYIYIYIGACPCRALKVINDNLKSILSFSGSQCSLCSIGEICSNFPSCVTSLAAVFWTRCSFSSWHDAGKPYNLLLRESSLDVMNAWTNLSQSSWAKCFRIFPMFLIGKYADLQVLLTCSVNWRWESTVTLRSRTVRFGAITASSTVIPKTGSR